LAGIAKEKKVEYEGMQYIGDSSPVDLKEGHSYECWTPGQDLAMHLKKSEFSGTKLVAVFQDSLGVRHHSKPLRFEIETYLVKKVEDPCAGDSHT
jgi:hypothetical protein